MSHDRSITRRKAMGYAAATMGTLAVPSLQARPPSKQILVVVGPTNHPPGTHEVAAGGRLLEFCLNTAGKELGLEARTITEWPCEAKAVQDVASLVFIGDLFPPEVMPERERILSGVSDLMKRGCGLVCVHFATGLSAKQVPADGKHLLLEWMGGYFATRCPHHQSVARVFPKATIEPTPGEHPVLRGWKSFTLHDEPYINNYFGKDGPADNVTALATSMLPPENPKRETVAWAVSRKDGGRGVAVVMPHFYRNWKNEDLRTLILNGIVWSAHGEVPGKGVRVDLPALNTFRPAAVEPPGKK